MDIPAPHVFKQSLFVPEKTLMGPGPSNCPKRVLQTLSLPVLGHMHPEVFKIMDDIKKGLQYIFQTKNTLTLAVSATGHGGMEAVLCNLLEPGETALIAFNGIWGERASIMATSYGAVVRKVEVPTGSNFTLQQLEEALVQHKPILLFVVQGESSSGVYQPLQGLGKICHKHNCLLVVDAVASLGGVPLYTDRWEIDAVYTGSQKVLGAPPGLAPITFSPRAVQKIFNRKTPPKVFYWDMNILGDYWDCFGRSRVYHHTVPSTLLYGLREALAMVSEEGLENVIQRHSQVSKRLHEGLRLLGIQQFVDNETARLPTITTIKPPSGVDWKAVVSYAMKNYSLELSGGLGPTVGKVIRIGIMGHNATPDKVDLVLKVLHEALDSVKETSKL